MDAALAAAAQALSHGDPLFALKQVALRGDAQALALRATALAQLGEYRQAKLLFARAARRFRSNDPLSEARCVVALSEVALAARELTLSDGPLQSAIDTLQRHGDGPNARYAELLRARHALALGDLPLAASRLKTLDLRRAPPALHALAALGAAEIALRRMQPDKARRALVRAAGAARRARIPALAAEVAAANDMLTKPLARRVAGEQSEPLSVAQVAALMRGSHLIIDACHRSVRKGTRLVSFQQRPVLFALARGLAQAAPAEVSREDLIRLGFGLARANASLRARLRVAMGRLRKMLAGLAEVRATPRGYALWARPPLPCVIAPPVDDQASSLLALLSDGEGWSTSALALALGSSQRSVQRALVALEAAGRVRSAGAGRSRRWLSAPLTGFAPHLLLPGASRAP